ncbi:MAG: hypothetical protein OXU20_29885 [Myxococcales bacterium]|nr:hypothetical protein [Myxococcales bacterium]
MTEAEGSTFVGRAPVTAFDLERSRVLLSDRGIDPDRLLGQDAFGNAVTAAGLHGLLGRVAASEKAGQDPIYALARLALVSGLPDEVGETLFLAYNQQSAEEAGHGDKVFGNAYFALGGAAPELAWSVVGNPGTEFLRPQDDVHLNRELLRTTAAAVGGVEVVALQRAFPALLSLCAGWSHPVARDLVHQINDVVRPEEARHVLIWRYLFHTIVVPEGEAAINAYFEHTNRGRGAVAAEQLDRDAFVRLVGNRAPEPSQLVGKERALIS